MALLGNANILAKNPMLHVGSVALSYQVEMANAVRPGSIRNWYAGSATASVSARASAFPSGYLHPSSWVLPPKSGGLSSRKRIEGTGEITDTANLAGGLNAEAAITGSGDLAALGALIVSAAATLSGSGDVTGSIVGYLQAQAALSGSATVAGQLNALASIIAALSGTGAATATATAKGTLAASINVTGDLLTTANVGDLVWAEVLEGTYTAKQVMQIVSAALAGKVSGGPNSPVFRSMDDTANRITATTDNDGNRTAVTLTPET